MTLFFHCRNKQVPDQPKREQEKWPIALFSALLFWTVTDEAVFCCFDSLKKLFCAFSLLLPLSFENGELFLPTSKIHSFPSSWSRHMPFLWRAFLVVLHLMELAALA
jgi:hypothetical protein